MPRVKTVKMGPPIAPNMEKAISSTPAGTTCRRKANPIIKRPNTIAKKEKYQR